MIHKEFLFSMDFGTVARKFIKKSTATAFGS